MIEINTFVFSRDTRLEKMAPKYKPYSYLISIIIKITLVYFAQNYRKMQMINNSGNFSSCFYSHLEIKVYFRILVLV